MWAVTVLYHHPKDPAAFEKYYADVHVPLVVEQQQAIGFKDATLLKFPRNLDGSKPAFYRQAVLWFDSKDALERGTASGGFQQVAGDLANFATGGLIALVGEQTS